MDTYGRITSIARNLRTGKWSIAIELDDASETDLELLSKLETVRAKIEKPRKHRSLNANAYFHVLVSRIASTLGLSNTEAKNMLIREYGAFEYVDGQIPTYLIKAEYENEILSREIMHFKVIGRQYVDGKEYIKAALMRGTHTYDTAEMARLIDGAVKEAKALGIETMPPSDLERMVRLWKGA